MIVVCRLKLVKESVWNSAEGVLVDNKADLLDDRIVQSADAKRLAEQHGLAFVETYASGDQRVGEALYSIFTFPLQYY